MCLPQKVGMLGRIAVSSIQTSTACSTTASGTRGVAALRKLPDKQSFRQRYEGDICPVITYVTIVTLWTAVTCFNIIQRTKLNENHGRRA
jgi:hypothetical protein